VRYEADGGENFVDVLLCNILSQRPVDLLDFARVPASAQPRSEGDKKSFLNVSGFSSKRHAAPIAGTSSKLRFGPVWLFELSDDQNHVALPALPRPLHRLGSDTEPLASMRSIQREKPDRGQASPGVRPFCARLRSRDVTLPDLSYFLHSLRSEEHSEHQRWMCCRSAWRAEQSWCG
jgi:hypothetical protein